MLLHIIPVFRRNYSFKNELSLEHVVEHLRESFAETTNELRELKFVTEDFSGFTKIESFAIVCETRRRKIERVIKFLFKILNVLKFSKVLSSRQRSNFSTTTTLSTRQPEILKHTHVLFIITHLASLCVIHKLVAIARHDITQVLFCFYLG